MVPAFGWTQDCKLPNSVCDVRTWFNSSPNIPRPYPLARIPRPAGFRFPFSAAVLLIYFLAGPHHRGCRADGTASGLSTAFGDWFSADRPQSMLDRDNLTGDWWGARDALQHHGIIPAVSFLQAASENFAGGIRTNRIDWRYRLDVSLTLNTARILGWKGGTAFVDFMAHGGENPALNLVGAVQAISAIDQNPATRLDQIWYKQQLAGKDLWFKLGRIDTTYDFDNIRDAQPFLNGSFGFTPTIFVFPSYPFSAWGSEGCWKPWTHLQLKAGLFDGNTENTLPAVASADPNAVENPYGLMAIGEQSVNYLLGPAHLSGTVTLGEWYHTGTFQTYAGTYQQDAHGCYVYLDQTLWKSDHQPGSSASRIGTFIQYGWANGKLTQIDGNLLGGLRWRGPIPGRPDDNLGLGASWAYLSRHAQTPYNSECIVEGFYSIQVTPWLNVQPDLQYVIHPGGTYANALVATVQVGIKF